MAMAFGAFGAAAQAAPSPPTPHYTITDLGTLGGTFSLAYGINSRGQISGFSTLAGDTVEHSFVRKSSRMIDLGALGGPHSQSLAGINELGMATGAAELDTPDPSGEDFCGFGTHLICRGFVWRDGLMLPLDTLGGHNSAAAMVNNFGVVAGYAETAVPDAACPPPQVLHYRPAVWAGTKALTLPLYQGDTEGAAFWLNDLGESVGASGVCATFDARYSMPFRPDHALLWRLGRAIDLGNLGGKFNNAAFGINEHSEVVGASELAGDTPTSGFQHAFLWRRGVMTDLGTLPGDQQSAAIGINNYAQATGVSVDAQGDTTGFLWQHGRMYNLNDLIPADSGMYILDGFGINDHGQVVGLAVQLVTGEVHGFLANLDNGGSTAVQVRAHQAKPMLSAQARRQIGVWVHAKRIGVRLAK
ncbi:hypothetical protein ASG75_04880 [Rhodanobacter sp. Soil772]|nr:hypothetical protein ASG75_04880 [Rhodanobacter sp. Soil772]